jgi:Flp pilus assembly protein TadB
MESMLQKRKEKKRKEKKRKEKKRKEKKRKEKKRKEKKRKAQSHFILLSFFSFARHTVCFPLIVSYLLYIYLVTFLILTLSFCLFFLF